MPIEYAFVFGVSFAAAFLSTPLLRRLAIRLDITDRPTGHKIHQRPIPYLGGLAFHVSATTASIVIFIAFPYLFLVQISLTQLMTLYIVATAFMIIGIWDDTHPVSPYLKLLYQAVLASVLVAAGFSIEQTTSPFGGIIPLGWLGWGLSVLWIMTIVNAINFIDGLDGLAAGIVFLAAAANFAIALSPWQNFVCVISLILMGATLGFLPYNFSPAKIFMGDAGSLFLGTMLAGSALVSNVKGATVLSLSLPLVILSIPLLDTLLTVIRRGRRGLNFFTADRGHLHHRLLRMGFSDRQAVLFLYGLCFLLAASAILASKLPDRYTLLFVFVFLMAMGWGLVVFHAFEKRIDPPGGRDRSAS